MDTYPNLAMEELPGSKTAQALDTLSADIRAGLIEGEVRERVLEVLANRAVAEADGATVYRAAELMASTRTAVDYFIRSEDLGHEGGIVAAKSRAADEEDAYDSYYSWTKLAGTGVPEAYEEAFRASGQIDRESWRLSALERLAEAEVPGATDAAYREAVTAEDSHEAVYVLVRLAEQGHPTAFATAIGRVATAEKASKVHEGIKKLADHELAKTPDNQILLEEAAARQKFTNHSPDIRVENLLELAKNGNQVALLKALDLAKGLTDPDDDFIAHQALTMVSQTALAMNEVNVAARAAAAMRDPKEISGALLAIAKHLDSSKSLDMAHKAALKIVEANERASMLTRIAEAGHPTALTEARTIMDTLAASGTYQHASVWGRMAAIYAGAGEMDEAISLVPGRAELTQVTIRGNISHVMCERALTDPHAVSQLHRLYRTEGFKESVEKAAENLFRAPWSGQEGQPLALVPFLKNSHLAEQLVKSVIRADK